MLVRVTVALGHRRDDEGERDEGHDQKYVDAHAKLPSESAHLPSLGVRQYLAVMQTAADPLGCARLGGHDATGGS